MTIEMKNSSFLKRADYNPDTQNLDVEMKGGKRYRYYKVSKRKYQLFASATSKGSYFSRKIRGQYKSRNLKKAA